MPQRIVDRFHSCSEGDAGTGFGVSLAFSQSAVERIGGAALPFAPG